MKVLNFGSVNIDHVYRVPHLVRPGETLASSDYHRFIGGKGLNQSVALARAGAGVFHAGMIGPDGGFIADFLNETGVDCRFLRILPDQVTGHAVIQVDDGGENSIVLYGGANRCITGELAAEAVTAMASGDILLLQNEISRLPEIMELAAASGLRIFFNPAPMDNQVSALPLELVDTFIVNRVEGAGLAGLAAAEPPEKILAALRCRYARAGLLLTLGAAGAVWQESSGREVQVPACRVKKVVDTTAAGDTFIGYFLAGIARGAAVEAALGQAAKAAALCVSRPGASASIPLLAEVAGR